jgi:hypothetical protein
MIVAEAFRPFSPSETVSLVHGHRAEALVYALDHLSHTILPDLALGGIERDLRVDQLLVAPIIGERCLDSLYWYTIRISEPLHVAFDGRKLCH